MEFDISLAIQRSRITKFDIMNTDDIQVFVAAVRAGSLAGAARRLGIPAMVATRRLTSLENELRVRLLHRTTRALSLTPEGEVFLPYAQSLLESEQEAKAKLGDETGGAVGLLRVSVSVAFGRMHIAPIIPALLQDNPELRIDLDMSDHFPDLVANGIDLAIRISRLRDSSMIAQKLAESPRILVASPDYIARHGKPKTVADLSEHICLSLSSATHWVFVQKNRELKARVGDRFSSSSIEGCHAACLTGGGIALLALWNVWNDLESGRLVRIELSDASPDMINIWAVYPTSRMVPQKVRVFLSALRQSMSVAGFSR
jgi:DNA-binding transcriptional LysR family regulator